MNSSFSLGHLRDDGSFRIVATLNNLRAELSDDATSHLLDTLLSSIHEATGQRAICYEREDAADCVDLAEDEQPLREKGGQQ